MRIPSQVYVSQQQQTAKSQQAQGGDASKAGAPQAKKGDVEVNVSSAAKQLADANAIDTAKVERLKAAIQDGSFQIDPQRIAQRIVDQE